MALAYFRILGTGDDFVRNLLAVQTRIQSEILREHAAATIIQAAWKRHKTRTLIKKWQESALTVQTTWRASVARRKLSEMREQKRKDDFARFFNKAATTIQARWRGYRTRRKVLNFYDRKRKLLEIQSTNEEIQQKIKANFQKQTHEEGERFETDLKTKVGKKLAKIHCLLSTKQVPGIYAKNQVLEVAIKEETRKVLHQTPQFPSAKPCSHSSHS